MKGKPDSLTEVHVLFSGPPGPTSGEFIEVEDSQTRESISLGIWQKDPDHPGWWMLCFEVPENTISRNPKE